MSLPPFISLRGLAVELCPNGRPLNDFKRELRRILNGAGLERRRFPGYRRLGRYMLADMKRHTPWLVEAWIVCRENKANKAA